MLLDFANECHQALGLILAYMCGLALILATANYVFEAHLSPSGPEQARPRLSSPPHSRPAMPADDWVSLTSAPALRGAL